MSEDNVNKIGGRRFMSRLQDAIGPEINNVEPFALTAPSADDHPEEVRAFAPPSARLAAAQRVTGSSRMQTIGQFVTALTYREAMAMGVGITGKMSKDGQVNAEALTRALQDWAWEWETFVEEERPVVKE
jgi:hypothetical protein